LPVAANHQMRFEDVEGRRNRGRHAPCSHVTALEPVDCLRANQRTQLTALRSSALYPLRVVQSGRSTCHAISGRGGGATRIPDQRHVRFKFEHRWCVIEGPNLLSWPHHSLSKAQKMQKGELNRICFHGRSASLESTNLTVSDIPVSNHHGGAPRFRWVRIPGCYVTKSAGTT